MASRYPASGPVTLKTNLADSALSAALKQGKVASPLVRFDFCGPPVASNGFKACVRERAFDCGELAIVTSMQARTYGKPITLLPATVVGRFQHGTISTIAGRGVEKPKDLEGKQMAVRAYTQTTGVWARGILQHQFGVDLKRITWVTSDAPHLSEYSDPPSVVRVDKGEKPLDKRLMDGEVAGGILGDKLPDHPQARHVIANPTEAAQAWHAQHGCTHINHMFFVDTELAAGRPDVVREIYRLLVESKAAAGLPKAGTIDALPFGFENVRKSMEIVSQYAEEQGVIPRRFAAREMFDHGTEKLGA